VKPTKTPMEIKTKKEIEDEMDDIDGGAMKYDVPEAVRVLAELASNEACNWRNNLGTWTGSATSSKNWSSKSNINCCIASTYCQGIGSNVVSTVIRVVS
jgi:hypothetical protein